MAQAHVNDASNVTELVLFSGYISNDAEASALKIVKSLDGCLRVYHGSQAHDSSKGLWVQEWLSLAHHAAFQRSEGYPAFVAGVSEFAGTVEKILHVCLKPYPAVAVFAASTTEIVTMKLKERASLQALMELTTKLARSIGEPGATWSGYACGTSLEDDSQYILMSGWPSLETQQLYSKRSETQDIWERIHKLADLNFAYYCLSE